MASHSSLDGLCPHLLPDSLHLFKKRSVRNERAILFNRCENKACGVKCRLPRAEAAKNDGALAIRGKPIKLVAREPTMLIEVGDALQLSQDGFIGIFQRIGSVERKSIAGS